MGKRCRVVSPFVAGLLIACGGSGGGGGSGSGSEALASLAISDAKALFIAGSSGQSGSSLAAAAADAGDSATEQGTLYKLTQDDRVLEVTQECRRDGRTSTCTTSLAAHAVYDAGPDYVMVDFWGDGVQEKVLARKSDGAAFLMTDFGFPASPELAVGNVLLGSTPVQTDATQDIYFAQQDNPPDQPGGRVVKLDVHDPGNITGTVITPENDEVAAFLVNGEGDVWYNWSNHSDGTYGERFRFEAGSYAYSPQLSPWVGVDGAFYALKPAGAWANSQSYDVQVYRLAPDASSMNEEPRGIMSMDGAALWGTWLAADRSDFRLMHARMLRSDGKIMLLVSSAVLEVQDPDHPTAHDVSCITTNGPVSEPLIGSSGQAIWYPAPHQAGGTGLGRFSLATDTCVELVDPATYDVATIAVGSDDVAQFTATRMSDGRKVLAKVDSQGTITVLDEGSLFENVSLVRIR